MPPNRLLAISAAILFGLLMWLYMREFAVFSNTLEVKRIVLGSILAGAILSGAAIWFWRDRFEPWERQFPTAVFILIFSMVFSPLFGSLINRGLGSNGTDPFEFVSETAYFASGYGVLKGEKLKPTGWKLLLRENGHEWRLSYKSQAFFPLTKTGEPILVPVRRGIFGVRVAKLK